MRVGLAAVLIALLSGCASDGGGNRQVKPASIGGGPNNLRRGGCACLQVKQAPGLPEFLAAKTSEIAA